MFLRLFSTRRFACGVLTLVGIALTLAACAPTVPLEAPKALLWPAAPAEPRIAYLKTISRPEDIGISKGFLRRLADIVFGANDAHLVRPMAVVAVDGILYVADPGAKGVHRFDTRRGNYDLIRLQNDAPLPSPVALARGADGDVYVSDSALAKVFVIRAEAKVASPVNLRAKLGQPTGIAFDSATKRLFVVDTTAHHVNVFSSDGTLESHIGGRGTAQGQFNYPVFIWRTPQGRLYVTDSLNFRVQSFDEHGHFIAAFGRLGDGTGDLARQKGVATDSHGHIYIVDAMFHAVQIFDESGRFLLSLGALGRERGEFWLPTGIFIGDDNTIYIADSYNQRVQILRYIGEPT